MHIDPFTIIVFNIIASFLMSAGLFTVLQSHFSDIKGIRHWATALLLLGIGWSLMILTGIIPNFFSMAIGTTLVVSGVAVYFHALVRFKEVYIPLQWAYLVVALAFIGNSYFVLITFNLDAKIVVTSVCLAILLSANSVLLFSKQHGFCPGSHRLTGSIFAFCACVVLVRAIYYLVWHTQAEQTLLHVNFIQDISYLASAITIVGTSFNFALMCNDKYIAEKNQAQLDQREALERLQKIASRVPGMVYQFKLSADGHFSVPYSSDGVYDIFQLYPAQIREDATAAFKRIHPDDYERFMASIDESAQKLTTWLCEFRVQFDDGLVRWLEGNSMPQRKQDGSVFWHGFISDITERKANEQQLHILSVAIEQSPASIMITDADANLLYVNPKFTEMTGYSMEEVIGISPCALESDLISEAVCGQSWDTLKQGKSWHGELMNRRKNGEMYWNETYIAPIKNSFGVTTHYVGIKLDITERKQAEAEILEAKEIAIDANQAKSKFLANMSHEIRTPLNAILGFSEILSHSITDKVHRYYLDALNASGKTLLQLINDILDLSKIEAGKLDLNCRPIEIEPVFSDIGMIFMQKMADKDISFSIEISENMPTLLVLDEIRLRQILLNIVGNAVKFTDKGEIRICVTMQPSGTDLSGFKNLTGLDLSIAIEDSGMGIAANQVDTIFSPFTQQKQQSVRYGGTGLGLTICKRLVEMMGGTISVRSKLGEGSCFTIELPQVEICSQAATAIEENSPVFKELHFQPATLLLVDDVNFNRELIKIYLSDYPELEIIEAESGERALALISQQHFDLIFMDRMLPGENGDTVCQKIRAIPDYATTPIIMITASALLLSAEHYETFYNIQLNKPVNQADLLTAMQSFLPLKQDANSSYPSQTAQTAQIISKAIVLAEKQSELLELLTANYQEQITHFYKSGVFEINLFIEIAEQLIQIAEQYHCTVLADWANTLKTQTQLFDITNLTKTLAGFDELLAQLRQ